MIHEQMMKNEQLRNTMLKSGKVPFLGQNRQSTKGSTDLSSDSKLFKRASYHVAIAYHIHIRKLKESGVALNRTEDIDPTCAARKLRERNSMGIQEEPAQKKS
jgi:hypothetical protein